MDTTQSNLAVVTFNNTIIKDLSNDVKKLEDKIIYLTQDKLNIERTIYDFNNQYNEKVGSILLKYLEKREKIAEGKTNNSTKDKDGKPTKEECNKAKEHINTSKRLNNKQKLDIFTLSEEEEAELKTLYKQACRLCHPDMVDDKFKEEAKDIFYRLNNANQKKDLEQVKKILDYLKLHNFILNKDLDNAEIIRKRYEFLLSELLKLEIEIKELQNNKTYKRITKIGNWNKYFKIIAHQLKKEIYKQEAL